MLDTDEEKQELQELVELFGEDPDEAEENATLVRVMYVRTHVHTHARAHVCVCVLIVSSGILDISET